MNHFQGIEITPEPANGFRQLTTGCVESEFWILQNVISDMQRGNISMQLVDQGYGVEVWRKGIKRR